MVDEGVQILRVLMQGDGAANGPAMALYRRFKSSRRNALSTLPVFDGPPHPDNSAFKLYHYPSKTKVDTPLQLLSN